MNLRLTLGWLLVAGCTVTAVAQESDPRIGKLAEKGIGYLAANQAADGSFSAQAGPGVTAMVTAAILGHGRSPEEPVIAKSLKYLEGFVREDGGIYAAESTHKNYETSLGILAFAAANRNGKYDALLKKAEAFTKDLQWGGVDGKVKSDVEYGGAGYGRSKRPDLSNTSFFLDALKSVGNDEKSEAMQRALVFVSRCQNLETEHNATPFPAKNPDGGFYYTPAGGGASMAGPTESGGLRSYASMTYAGLKSMIYAGVNQDDPRVKAAVEWIKKNYDLKSNPGMGQAGLYYYYQTSAKALSAMKLKELVDDKGVKHNWREEMVTELASRQKENGSWLNETPRWMEGDANLATSFALFALASCAK